MNQNEKSYDDIINTQWPKPERVGDPDCRERMRLEDRAKIFLPFAALKGFDEEIEKRRKAVIKRLEEKD